MTLSLQRQHRQAPAGDERAVVVVDLGLVHVDQEDAVLAVAGADAADGAPSAFLTYRPAP